MFKTFLTHQSINQYKNPCVPTIQLKKQDIGNVREAPPHYHHLGTSLLLLSKPLSGICLPFVFI